MFEESHPAERRRRALLKEFELTQNLRTGSDRAPTFRLVVVLTVIGFLIASAMFPAVYVLDGHQTVTDYRGFMLILFGWMGLGNDGGVAWTANALILVSVWLAIRQRDGLSALAGLSAIFLSAKAASLKQVLINEAGGMGPVLRFGLGYHLWQTAIVVSFLGPVILWIMNRPRHSRSEQLPPV